MNAIPFPKSGVDRPTALPVLPETIPGELKMFDSWVLWRYEWKDKRWTKVPYTRHGTHAKTNDAATWCAFDGAYAAYERSGYDGIGLVMVDGLAGVDLDHAGQPDAIEPWAATIMEQFAGAYAERSPSGEGYRIFVRGNPRRCGKGGPGNHVEVYDEKSPRFLTVTGYRVSASDAVPHAQAALDWLHEAHMKRDDPPPGEGVAGESHADDDEIIRRASEAANGAKFTALMRGEGGGDASSNDMALCCLLAFWTRDPVQIDRIFRTSGLMRPKWDERRADSTYGADTIAHALQTVTTFYSWSKDRLRDKALDDFWHYAPDNRCIYLPTAELWACASVDMAIRQWPKNPADGEAMKPSRWLARHRAVDQITWHPGRPQVQSGVSVRDGGYIEDGKTRVFNFYRGPMLIAGDASKAGPWLDHVRLIYPETAEHIIAWLAHRVQHPGVKCNHALVLGGDQGIGKDTLLEPVKTAVGPWNWSEISPAQMLGRFNGWAKAVVVRVSEARDLGDTDRFAFYDHSKTYIAAPPDVLRVDEKNIREHAVFNVCGVIITTNHRTDGIYLPPDDRRHHVSWSDAKREQFSDDYWRELWGWFERGGIGHVCAYLRTLDLSGFNPKAPPQKTRAFMAIVQANQAPEDAELADLLDALGSPVAVCIESLVVEARRTDQHDVAEMLTDKRGRRAIPHKMERAGYEQVRNPDAEDGLFKIGGRRRAVYARRGVSLAEQIRAARGVRYV